MSQPFIVEFAGMMGAGKTTISNLVIQELRFRGHHCAPKDAVNNWMEKSGFNPFFSPKSCGFVEKLTYYSRWSFLIAALRFPAVALKAYRYAFSVSPKNKTSWQISRSSMNWMGVLKKYVAPSHYDVIIFEDAGIQLANDVAFAGDRYSKTAHKDLVSTLVLNQNHIIVFLKIDVDNAIKRIEGRAEAMHRQGLAAWEYEEKSKDFQLQKAFQAIDVFNSTAKLIKEISPHSLIEIDALKDPKENAKTIVALIEKAMKVQIIDCFAMTEQTEYHLQHWS